MNRDYSDIFKGMRILNLTLILVILCAGTLHAQSDKRYIRQGNREYEKKKFSESEILYRKAADKNKNSPEAVFNAGDALYKQKKYEDAGKQFMENVKMSDDRTKKSAAMFNLGNSMLKANKLSESIDAYKGSLKLNPENLEAKYNLGYAQDMLRKQQEQKQQQSKDKQNQNKDQNKKDQKNDQKDQKDQNSENKDKQKNDKQNQDQQQQDQQQISKDDAQRLLNALANEEKNVQEKVKLAKAAKEKVRSVKNW
jgi:Ca-activated chloride channel family protein